MIIAEIADIICPASRFIRNEKARVSYLCYDSRKVDQPEGTLFFAFKTAQNDGHRFIPELLLKGVRNFVVTDPTCTDLDSTANFLVVNDTLAALQTLAQHHRLRFHYPVIGITGSNGKTIVK